MLLYLYDFQLLILFHVHFLRNCYLLIYNVVFCTCIINYTPLLIIKYDKNC